MALTTNTIYEGRHGVSSINSELEGLNDTCSNLLNKVQSNPDFQIFCQNTAFGAELNEKITRLLQIIQRDIATGITEITGKTTKFLNNQEALNNRHLESGSGGNYHDIISSTGTVTVNEYKYPEDNGKIAKNRPMQDSVYDMDNKIPINRPIEQDSVYVMEPMPPSFGSVESPSVAPPSVKEPVGVSSSPEIHIY